MVCVCVLACVCAEPLAKKKHLGRRGEDGEKKMAGKRKGGARPPLVLYDYAFCGNLGLFGRSVAEM